MRNIRMFVAESQLSEGGVGIDRSLDKRRPPEQPSTGRNTPAWIGAPGRIRTFICSWWLSYQPT